MKKRQTSKLRVLAVGGLVALAITSTPARADHDHNVIAPAIAFIALGFILMIGGGSDDPNVFNPEIYSWRRIRLAPALILNAAGIEIYAILLNPKSK